MRAFFRYAAYGLALFVIAAAVLYQFFGLRIVLTGGGMPRPRFVESAEAQAARIERHRAEQRARYAAVDAAPETAAPAPPVRADATGDAEAANEAAPIGSGELEADATSTPPAYWTDFRGPLRDGHYRERPLRLDWPAGGLTPVWKQPAGGGYASFVIAHERAFTIEQRGPQEVLAAYDVRTGRELWTSTWPASFEEAMGGDGPRASPTWADGRVFALGAEGELRAHEDRTGRLIWRTNILEDTESENLQWGMAGAPLVLDGRVIVQPAGRWGPSVAAYDAGTGALDWTALEDQQGYASPMLATLAGTPQLVIFTSARLVGLDLETREILWQFSWPGPNGINAAQPLLLPGDRIFISSGYGMGAAVVEITKNGTSGFSVREVWRNTRMKNRFASSVVHEGYIYGLDESILAAIDAETGALAWKGGRYGYGQVLLAGGHLIVLTEDGDLALVRATPTGHDELARFPVLSGKTWNVPAIGDGLLLVRNLAEMAAFDLRVR